jgi:aminopeptidase N
MRPLLTACTFLLGTSSLAFAQRLPATVAPTHYDLTFGVDIAHARFDGTTVIQVDVTEPTSRIVLNAAELTIRDVAIGRTPSLQQATVALDADKQQATFTVPRRLERGPTQITIHYTGILNDQLRGFYLSKGKGRDYAVTQFESTDARRAFPCFDEPSFKATFSVTVVADRGDRVISNGRTLSDVGGPVPARHTVKFAQTPKMSSYLVAIAVGDFACTEGAADGIPIRICATPDKKNLTRLALESAQEILHFYNTYYAIKYPFEKLDVLAVPDFAAGAMENTAAIFYRETDLLADARTASVRTRKNIASVLAHEMAHQWFGDLVTMGWWDDIWLNEGFATWMSNKPLAALHPEWNMSVDEAIETQQALSLDAMRATRPVHNDVTTPAEIDEAFDTIAYQKGAALLRMIESYVGADTFRKGINAYLQAHAYGNATSEDFWKAITSTSQKPVERILPTFVDQPGAPLVVVGDVRCEDNVTRATLHQDRFRSDAGNAAGERWSIPVCTKAASGAGTAGTCAVVNEQSQRVDVARGCPAWVFANAGAEGYYRTDYPPALLRAMAPDVEAQLTGAERLSLVNDEWAMVRAGRHSIADYLTLATGFGRESTSGVLGEVTDRLAFIREYMTTGATRASFESFVRTLLRPSLTSLGFTASASDSDERRSVRAALVDALGTIADDPDVIAQARQTLDRALAGGPPLDPTTADAIVSTAAAHGDATLFTALGAAASRASSPDEQYRYLNALTDFQDPALIDRALARVLTPDVRSQDAPYFLGRFFDNPAARDRAWAYVTAHWSELQSKVVVFGGDVRVVAATGALCDAASRDAVKSFFAAHPLPAAARTLAQSLERIDTCIALREKQTPAVAQWLAERKP